MRGIVGSLSLLFLAACTTVPVEPALPMPERPPITFHKVAGGVCMTDEDAGAFFTYVEKLNAFEAARERLLKP